MSEYIEREKEVETVKENKELIQAALRLKTYCTDHGGNCGGCPFFRPFASHDLAINDCRLCDVYPEKWEIGEGIGNE